MHLDYWSIFPYFSGGLRKFNKQLIRFEGATAQKLQIVIAIKSHTSLPMREHPQVKETSL